MIVRSGTASDPLVIQICSDLHLEAWQETSWPRADVWRSLIIPSAPYLALVGDISTPGMICCNNAPGPANLAAFLRWTSRRFSRVFIVPGNHELFSLSSRLMCSPGVSAQAIIQCITDICDSLPGVELLFRRSVVIDDVRIIGATLWSYIDLEHDQLVSLVENCIADYHRILVEVEDGVSDSIQYRTLRASDTVRWHNVDKEFIKEEIRMAQLLGQRALVLTHHAPTAMQTCKPEHTDSVMNCAFATDLSELLEMRGLHTWVYGHTHWNARLYIDDVFLVSNQFGYKRHGSDSEHEACGIAYDPNFVIYI